MTLTQIEIPVKDSRSMPRLVGLEVRLDVRYLNVGLVRFEFRRIDEIRVLDDDYVLRAESLGVKVLQSGKYLRQFGQSRLLVNKFLGVEIAESSTVKAYSEVGTEHALARELFYPCISFVQFPTKNRMNVNVIRVIILYRVCKDMQNVKRSTKHSIMRD